MTNRKSMARALLVATFAAALLSTAAGANAGWASALAAKPHAPAGLVVEVRARSRAPVVVLPMGPAYVYYDYPYYYSRGYYPTHIVRYVYAVPRSARRCNASNRSCVAGWSRKRRLRGAR